MLKLSRQARSLDPDYQRMREALRAASLKRLRERGRMVRLEETDATEPKL